MPLPPLPRFQQFDLEESRHRDFPKDLRHRESPTILYHNITMAATAHLDPFPYEDAHESPIRSLIAHNNKYDPHGRLNDLCVPPERLRQSLFRPKWYSPSLHANAPYLSVSIAPSKPTTTLNSPDPFLLTVTLTHDPSPSSNPENRSATFELDDLGLTHIDRRSPYPWLLLHHTPTALEGELKEVELEEEEDGSTGAHPSEAFPGYEEPPPPKKPLVKAANGFISLAVEESRVFEVKFDPAEGLVERGGRYEICFRGKEVGWWEFGSVEDLEGKGVRKGEVKEGAALVVPCSNLVELTVGEGSGETVQ